MDHVRHISRLLGACVAALALSLNAHGAAFSFSHANATSSGTAMGGNASVTRYVQFTGDVSGCQIRTIQWFGETWATIATGTKYSGVSDATERQAYFSWSGLSSSNQSVDATANAKSYTVAWRRNGGTVHTFEVPLESCTATVTYNGGDASFKEFELPPLVVDLDGETATPDEPEAEKKFGKGILMLDNQLGHDYTFRFGDEDLTLKPGMNAFPFYGEVDQYGMPTAPTDAIFGKTTGPDGQNYFTGKVGNGVESTRQWEATTPTQIMQPQTSTNGPTVKFNNSNGTSTYFDLPAGMTAGNNLPLPGGMTAGSPGLPKGVTGGSSGALPNGVISGGNSYLPSGVSAGTVKGNTGSTGTGGTGGTGGGSGTAGTGTNGNAIGGGVQTDETTPYVAGPDMSKMYDDGVTKGRDSAEKLANGLGTGLDQIGDKAKGVLGGEKPKWWTAQDGWFSASDSSWTSFSIPIAQWTPHIEIPTNLIGLIRAIMVWGIKLWFVVACIKLLMK